MRGKGPTYRDIISKQRREPSLREWIKSNLKESPAAAKEPQTDTAGKAEAPMVSEAAGEAEAPPVSETDDGSAEPEEEPSDRGLLYFRKWWELSKADISVGGELLTGIPVFISGDSLRLVNDNYSYFIPLEKIEYIRTTDGLRFDALKQKL